MKKSLVALAVVGAFSAPAMADVTISGAINVGPVWGRSSDSSAAGTSNDIRSVSSQTKSYSATALTSNYSNINITSTDDIGGGNKLVFNYSLDVSNSGSTVHDPNSNANTSTGAIGNVARARNTNMQIQGSWGSVGMGINEHIYERYQYSTDVLDGAVGIGGNLQMLGSAGGGAFDNGNANCTAASGCMEFYRRQGHSIFFDSANYGGVTFGAAFSLNAYKTSSTDTDNPRFWSFGAKYAPEGGPFFLDAAYERHNNMYGLNAIAGVTGGTRSKDSGLQVGGGVSFGNISVNLRWERLNYKITSGISGSAISQYERDAVWAGLKLTTGTGYAGLQVGMADDGSCDRVNGASCDAKDTGAFMITGGYFHNLSNQTQLQFLFSRTNNDSLANYVNIGSPGGGAGSDGTSIGFGIKHVF